jgi:hypothetical protein
MKKIASNDSFSDPEDEDLADEMNYMTAGIDKKDIASLRLKPDDKIKIAIGAYEKNSGIQNNKIPVI